MLEVERYELNAGPAYRFEPDRRDFFKILGGGIVVLLTLAGSADAQQSAPQDINAWLHIGEDGKITFFSGKVEIGQNVRTSLTQAVSEELHTPAQSIQLILADTDMTPFDRGTFGSQSTPRMAPQMRRAAAAARELLIDLAAAQWKADRSTVRVEDGKVSNTATGKVFTFGELTKGKALVKTVGSGAPAKPAGRSLAKVNGREIVTGAHQYTSDLKRPGMLHGKVLRPSALESKLASVDTKDAEAMAGVQVVRDGNFVGVIAPDTATAARAIAAMKADWKSAAQPSSKDLYPYLKSNVEGDPGRGGKQQGSLDDGFRNADHKLEASYNVAYIAHVPLEPRASVAEWNGDKLTVWTGTQVPFGVRSELAEAFQVPENRVRVIVPDMGSGYGGKHSGECAVEAARLAKAAGKPVRLVWSREEEFHWAYFRPAGVIDIRSAVKEGVVTAWEFHNYNSGGSGIDTPYDVANQKIQFHSTRSPMRQGSYRGLAATANHFARESHMDDLAHAAKLDPLEFRYRNLKDQRMKAVLQAASSEFGWSKKKARANRGFGIACGFEKGGYVACCAEVSIDPASHRVKVERVTTAFECGAIVNPEHLKNQVDGAIAMGVGGALFEAIEFENGKILNGKLSKYRVPRFSDMPVLHTVLIDRKDLDSAGAGETPIVGLAPAIGNAIFNMTGVRLRALPMVPNGLET
jgi:nicotinate dehydrogenase subunit B